MRSADWCSLQEKIIRPGIDKFLVPLMLYRGTQGLGWMHRKWNFAIQCMESEVLTYTEAVKLSRNPDFCHLGHAVKKVDHTWLGSIFGRMLDNPNVTENVKGLTEYVREIEGVKHRLTPVSLYTNDPNHPERGAPWRIKDFSPERKMEREAKRRYRNLPKLRDPLARLPTTERLEFRFMAHRPKDGERERAMLTQIHDAIPLVWPAWLRADFCQDLVTGILAGQMHQDVLEAPAEFVSLILEAHPLKYQGLRADHALFALA